MSLPYSYIRRIASRGSQTRDRWIKNTQKWINRRLPSSPSYYKVLVDGAERNCAVLTTQNMNEKKICSMPGETLRCGAYVEWMDNTWLIKELDAANEVYQSAIMLQCNYELKWVNDNGEIVSRWVYVEDGTKYLTGEYYQRMMTVGDSRMQVTMPRDSETDKLNRGFRFIIDTVESNKSICYEITKLNRAGYTYNGNGVYVHMLTECNRRDEEDNYELMIANYYSRIKQYSVSFLNVSGDITLRVSDTADVKASVMFNGSETNKPVSYKTSNKSVATVTDEGHVVAVSSGECAIIASYLTFSESIKIIVKDTESDAPKYFSKHIDLKSQDGSNDLFVNSSKTIFASVVVNGAVKENAPVIITVLCEDSVASFDISGCSVSLHASQDRNNIGKTVIVSAISTEYDLFSSITLTVRGWL